MSLYGMMRTGVSGMNAQASRLGTVADNIANSSTTGYKRARAEFSTLVLPQTGGSYASGGVTTTVQRAVSAQGVLQYTTSATDLAVSGNGFFVVQDMNGNPFMTRGGAFVPDGQGRLVNAAGYQLMGYNYANGEPTITANGFAGLEPVSIAQLGLQATPSSNGFFSANLQSTATDVAAGSRPSNNVAGSTYTHKSSMVVYDNLGGEKMIDLYFTKSGANTWEVTAFDRAGATPGANPFPYTGGALGSQTLSFNPANGQLTTASADSLSFTIPGGGPFELDLSTMSQLTGGFTTYAAEANGNPPSGITGVEISGDGTLYAQYADGSFRALWRIPLADVQSPDKLTALPGNVYSQSADSGSVRIGFAGQGSLGVMVSGALENSNVDIATELTSMIESQRSYTANSKVFQTGSDLMDVLVNLKR